MNRIFALLVGVFLTLPAFAGDDRSITAEFIWGLGGTTTHKGFALRVGRDNAEVHVAHWFGPRGNTALGLGVVARTEGDGQVNDSFFNASGQVGLSYVFKTNSVLTTHFQPYFRADGTANISSGGDTEVVLSYSRYGFLTAEQFGGIGLRFNDRYDPAPEPLDTQGAPEDENPEDDDDGSDDDGSDDDGSDDDGSDDDGSDDDGSDDDGSDDDGSDDDGSDDDGSDDDGSDDGSDDDGSDDDDGNNGHGNDEDGCDESNPGNGGPSSCNE